MNPFEHITGRLSRELYVIVLKDDRGNLTLIADPGMNKPWSSKNKRFAEKVAQESGGAAYTWEDAFSLLRKANPKFEHDLIARIEAKAQQFQKDVSSAAAARGSILGADGKPVS